MVSTSKDPNPSQMDVTVSEEDYGKQLHEVLKHLPLCAGQPLTFLCPESTAWSHPRPRQSTQAHKGLLLCPFDQPLLQKPF